ncbi:histone transcription regulator 3 [Parathielavia appendiculata]|uniref:Histone transcription regulator 3 homolog n=1 Tax=Parathielavia appendiculata TaxID=2587402 RepID=A0AAN6Z4V2_9PEZI|nr:histone transcription regulator 3 [Parathielavia appendiculata]
MAAFSAINVEPEENIDEEVDTTKELQVEDALKLFQNALKLHAQGPQFFDQAADAYDALFESEIFRYPESKTDYERTEAGQDAALATEPVFAQGLPVVGADVDGIGSTLPQALYLSYKNRGQFLIDRIKHKARSTVINNEALLEDPTVQKDARGALDDFCAALDRDPSDAELWRKAARVAAFLRSARVSRYSLEAAIELDDDPAVDEVEPPSLAEGFAGEQLKEQLQILDDKIALTHPIMKPFVDREMPPYLARFMDPMPFLPNPTNALPAQRASWADLELPRLVLPISKLSWAELGAAIVRFFTEQGLSGLAVSIQPPDTDERGDVQMVLDTQLLLPQFIPAPDPPAEVSTAPETVGDQPSGEAITDEPDLATTEPAPTDDQPSKERGIPMPTRKRSQSTAGILETLEDEATDVKRSKRTRRRDTAAEEVMDSATFLASQLQPLQAADQNLFQTTKNLLENLGVTDHVTLCRIAEVLDSCASDDRAGKIQNQATVDLHESILHFDEDIGSILVSKRELPQLSLSAFLEHAKSVSQRAHEAPAFDDSQGLRDFVEKRNQDWSTIHDIAYEYVKAVARTYIEYKWADQLKTAVVHVISQLDGIVYDAFARDLELCLNGVSKERIAELAELAQMLLELHLDVYEHQTDPNSATDQEATLEAKCRMDRWMGTAVELTRLRNPCSNDSLSLRFLWAAVCSTTMAKGAPRDHVLNCWHSLRDFLAETGPAELSLPNNSLMPEISVAAAEREISKLTTMDFFLGLFHEDTGDPISVVENLEPVLNPDSVYISIPVAPEPTDSGDVDSTQQKKPITECASQELMDLWKFLRSSSTELRLLLWSRLGEAYGKIHYTTKQFSCFLRRIETVMSDLERDEYIQAPDESRKNQFMGLLKALDDLIIQALHLALNDNSSFDIIDEDHLRSSMSALAKVSCMLHVAAIYEDETRLGMKPVPASSSALRSFLNKLQEMQVRTWSLQYTMLKVGLHQHPDLFPKPENDLADYLAAVHQVLGLRKCCKSSNKIFLKMMRVEFLKQKNIDNWEDYLGQVLYDLHGLKLGVGIWEVQDHGCEPENLEKRQALQLVERVTMLANRMSMKDLLKSDLKTTIERMQQAIGSAKSSPQMAHNLRNYSEYLKAPIHPLHLYQALTGSVDLDAVTINTPESAPAKQGWFFLLGMIALTKFKGVDLNRRQTPGATDDLRIGATFLRLQLQYTPDRWDAWFRLAECFDYELEESILWTADKINKERPELVKLQRNAIHSYIMALSHSYAWASDPAVLTSVENDKEALYDMYHEFGMRMYSSSREPFAMEPFQHADQKRIFIEPEGSGTYKKILHNEMTDYQVWKFAARLFRKAMEGKPKDWKNPYMVAKCLWKMYQKPPEELDEKNRRHRPSVRAVIAALEKTVEVVSSLPKPRHSQDPILEPHYKIVSVVHKLVKRGDLTWQDGAAVLQRQPFSPDRGKETPIDTWHEWEDYVIRCVRFLREKDKSNWQHRIIMRHARMFHDMSTYPSGSESSSHARSAFNVLRENMFTKTMVMNVWKCDAERPGRHHVYTERYIRYMVGLLNVLNDRVNLEAVLRRIRKKGADFYHFNELWQYCVLTYVKLIRQTSRVPTTGEDAFKSLNPDEFDVVGERITDWATSAAAEDNPALSAMKEAVELKKLNANLMKAGPIDDLITDCYAAIYLAVFKTDDARAAERHTQTPSSPSQQTENQQQQPPNAEDLKSKLLLHTLAASARDKSPSSLSALGSLRAGSEQPADKSERHSVAGDGAVPRSTSGGKGAGGGIRRPNILRKAEHAVQAVLRAAEGSAPRSAGAGGAGGAGAGNGGGGGGGGGKTRSRVGSVSSGTLVNWAARRGGGEETEEGEDVDMKDVDNDDEGAAGRRGANGRASGDGGGGREEGSEISSPPDSVHDSADDESDLSDVPADYEDDAPPSLLFPNLRRSVDAGVVNKVEGETTEEESEAGEEEDELDEGEGDREEEEEEGEGNSENGNEEGEDEQHEGDEEREEDGAEGNLGAPAEGHGDTTEGLHEKNEP